MPISPFIGHLQLEYYRGWHRDIEFEKFLTDNWLRDSDAGTTTAGPHRAELRFKVNEKLAKTTVSRGQGKLIIAAIVGAQARYLCDHGAERPILLVDDLASELDRNARKMAVDSLMDTKSQIFFTAIEATDLPNDLTDIAKMFHVEQGKILPLDSVGV
jgi:DNA replication and repair protein RecF